MVSIDADEPSSSTVQEWDFESALELIRFQTLALGLQDGKSTAAGYVHTNSLSPGIEQKGELAKTPSLGNFEEILKCFTSPSELASKSKDANGKRTNLDPEDKSTELTRILQAEPVKPQLTNEEHSDAATPEQNVDLESQDRRRVIRNLVGLSDEDKLAKKQPKANTAASTGIKPILLRKGRDLKGSLAGPDKKLQIMELLFGDTKQTTLVAKLASPAFPLHGTTDGNLHVFVDISNILIGFHDALKRKRGISKDVRIPRERLCFFNLSLVMERGRPIAKRVLAGSDDLESVEEARQMGYEVNLLQRVFKDKELSVTRKGGRRRRDITSGESESEGIGPNMRRVEQGVDEILHLKMLESIVDTEVPSVIVLASGDAAEAEYSGGFLRMVERALTRGWKVEVVAFRENLSAAYRSSRWLRTWDEAFRIVELDPFAELLRLD